MVLHHNSLDYRIILALYENGRATMTDIAKKLDCSRQHVSNRISALEQKGIIKGYNAIVDPKALGFEIQAIIELRIDLKRKDEIITKIFAMPEIYRYSVLTGMYDVQIQGVFNNKDHLAEFIGNKLVSVPGIREQTTKIILREYWKPSYFSRRIIESPLSSGIFLDEIDRRVLTIVQREGRITIKKIAKRIQISEQTASKRLKRLESEGIIRFYRIRIDRKYLGLNLTAYIEVKVSSGIISKTIESILESNKVRKVYVTSGQNDLHFEINTADVNQLYTFLYEDLSSIPSISNFHSFISIDWDAKYFI